MTEKEALREGYQSDIHHANLSLGSGPASREPPTPRPPPPPGGGLERVRVRAQAGCGRGDTATHGSVACREGEVGGASAQVSRLSRCRVEGSGEH